MASFLPSPLSNRLADVSLLLVTGRSPWEAAEGLSAWLRRLELGTWPLEQVVVRGAAPVVLDGGLTRYGVPTRGAASRRLWGGEMEVTGTAGVQQ